jgi:hypothetical protein
VTLAALKYNLEKNGIKLSSHNVNVRLAWDRGIKKIFKGRKIGLVFYAKVSIRNN